MEPPVEQGRPVEDFLCPPGPLDIPNSLRWADDPNSPKPVQLCSGSNLDGSFGMNKVVRQQSPEVDVVVAHVIPESVSVVPSARQPLPSANASVPVLPSGRQSVPSARHALPSPIESVPVIESFRPHVGNNVSSRPVGAAESLVSDPPLVLNTSSRVVLQPQTPPSPAPPADLLVDKLTIDQLMDFEGFGDDHVVLGLSAEDDGSVLHSVGVSLTLVELIPDEIAIPDMVDLVSPERPGAPDRDSVEPTVTPVDPKHITQHLTEESLIEAFYPVKRSAFEGLSPINAKLSMSDYVSVAGQEDLKKLTPNDYPSSIKSMHKFESTVFVESPRPSCSRFWARMCRH